MGLDRINSGSGGSPKHTPDPKGNQGANGGTGGNNMQSGGSTPQGRAAAKNHPSRELRSNG